MNTATPVKEEVEQKNGSAARAIGEIEEARQFLTEAGVAVDEIAPLVEGKFMSAFIRATKPVVPASGACCAPGCCAAASAEGKV